MKGKFDQLIATDTPVLIDFYADWCGPCQMMSPVLKEIASESGGKLKVIKIDVDKNQPIAQRFGVRSIPTFILFKKGEKLGTKAGVLTKRDLKQWISPFL